MNTPVASGLQALVPVLTALLRTLRALEFIGRHLDPERLGEVVAAVGEPDAELRIAREACDHADHDTDALAPLRAQLLSAADAALAGLDGLRACAAANDLRGTYRAMRREAVALEALYPLAALLAPVDGFFLEESARADADLRATLADPAENSGVLHAANGRGERGGVSLYVPESYTPDVAHPLVVALHGGSGHGRAFLWNWVRTARSRGLILACPTAVGPTWALAGPDVDTPNLARIVDFVRARWNIDPAHMLLSGMSDGGSFTLLSGLQPESPFTHLAPFAAGFHPLMAELADPGRARDLPIRLTHGALDWMFPVELAHTGQRMLRHIGARVSYREIDDLAHTYPRDENPALVDWFLGGEFLGGEA